MKQFGGVVPLPDTFDLVDTKLIDEIKNAAFKVGELIYQNQIDKAMKEI